MIQMYNKKQKKGLQSNFTQEGGTRIWKVVLEEQYVSVDSMQDE